MKSLRARRSILPLGGRGDNGAEGGGEEESVGIISTACKMEIEVVECKSIKEEKLDN